MNIEPCMMWWGCLLKFNFINSWPMHELAVRKGRTQYSIKLQARHHGGTAVGDIKWSEINLTIKIPAAKSATLRTLACRPPAKCSGTVIFQDCKLRRAYPFFGGPASVHQWKLFNVSVLQWTTCLLERYDVQAAALQESTWMRDQAYDVHLWVYACCVW